MSKADDLTRRQVLDELYRQKALLTFIGDAANAKRIDEVCYFLTCDIYREPPRTGLERVIDPFNGGDMLTEVIA